jgi:UDP-glucose 4-epimerase/UDP-glucuronate decarboxylase
VSKALNVLITGGAGFLGLHLARRLAAEGCRITLVDNFVRGRRDRDLEALAAQPGVRLLPGDLTRPETLAALGDGYDEVYHLAAIIGVQNVLERPAEVVRVNAMATLLLLDWFVRGGARKFLFSSTSEAYAWTQGFHPLPIPTPEQVPLALTELKNPRSSYAGSKIFGELAVTQYGLAHHLPTVIVRYHNVYGPRMGFEHVIPQLYQRALAADGPLTVYSPDHLRAFCHVADAVTATVAAMRNPAADGGTFNIGNDQAESSIADLALRILALAGKPPSIHGVPAANDPIRRRCPDITLARTVLGFEPKVDLQAGLEDTLRWYGPVFQEHKP